jgi:hypothetical protein
VYLSLRPMIDLISFGFYLLSDVIIKIFFWILLFWILFYLSSDVVIQILVHWCMDVWWMEWAWGWKVSKDQLVYSLINWCHDELIRYCSFMHWLIYWCFDWAWRWKVSKDWLIYSSVDWCHQFDHKSHSCDHKSHSCDHNVTFVTTMSHTVDHKS